MRVLITGAAGFIAKNLCVKLREFADIELLSYTRESDPADLGPLVSQADMVVHLAGVSRPADTEEFWSSNVTLTRLLTKALYADGRGLPLIFASSIQARLATPYGRSKWEAEQIIKAYGIATGAPTHVYRLPNVFGKWARPNYNSAIATFAHNIAHGLPIRIDDPAAVMQLVYVDDVVDEFVRLIREPAPPAEQPRIPVEYRATVGEVAASLQAFKESRDTLTTPNVGTGLQRALHATYLSYLPPTQFSYPLPRHSDPRGDFVEVLKTQSAGQFSFFTAPPGITRGGHYHHSKTEKFLVLRGNARFRFRQVVSGATHELSTTGDRPEVVETVPGWTHDITNVGDQDMIVMLWANEVFNRNRPDTIAAAL